MPVDCSPAGLAQSSKCFECLSVQTLLASQTYLLNVISGLNLSPQELANRAACYRCLDGMHAEIQDYLLCQIANS